MYINVCVHVLYNVHINAHLWCEARVVERQTVVGISFNAPLTDWVRDVTAGPNTPDHHLNPPHFNHNTTSFELGLT